MLSYDGGTTYATQATPVNDGEVKFSRIKDLGRGQLFFRTKLATELEFGDEFTLWWARRKSALNCEAIYIQRQYFCGGIWKEKWTGKFSVASANFDLERCKVRIAPLTVDRYSCFLEKMNTKVNLMDVPATEITSIIWPTSIEVAIVTDPTPPVPLPSLAENGWVVVDDQSLLIPALCSFPSFTQTYYIIWREIITTPCVDGQEVEPPGVGWFHPINGAGGCGIDGTTTWVRLPVITWPWPNDPLYVGQVAGPGGTLQPPLSPDCQNWIRVGIVNPPGGCAVGLYLCGEEATAFETFPRGRELYACTRYLLEKMDCDTREVVSDFFEWNPPEDAPDYFPGFNYVTQEPNQVDHLFLLQTSDAADPTATDPATIGEMTMVQFLVLLRQLFRVFWDIDDQGNLRLEHYKFYTYSVGLDMTTTTGAVERYATASISKSYPRYEKFKFAASRGIDFVGADIVYPNACTATEDGNDVELNEIAIITDVAFVFTDPTAVDQRGFVMVATSQNGLGQHSVILDNGALTGLYSTNAPLSIANLHDDFYRWDRYFIEGQMNNEDTIFDGALANIEQSSATVPLCCETLTFDPRNSVRSSLGEDYLGGRLAQVSKVEDIEKGNLTSLTLQYYL